MIMRVIPRGNPLLFELVVIVFPIVRIWAIGALEWRGWSVSCGVSLPVWSLL
jgi:hypothetical protein